MRSRRAPAARVPMDFTTPVYRATGREANTSITSASPTWAVFSAMHAVSCGGDVAAILAGSASVAGVGSALGAHRAGALGQSRDGPDWPRWASKLRGCCACRRGRCWDRCCCCLRCTPPGGSRSIYRAGSSLRPTHCSAGTSVLASDVILCVTRDGRCPWSPVQHSV